MTEQFILTEDHLNVMRDIRATGQTKVFDDNEVRVQLTEHNYINARLGGWALTVKGHDALHRGRVGA